MSYRDARGHRSISVARYGWGSPASTCFLPGILLLVTAQFVDILTTIGALTLVPSLTEANPFAVAAMESIGLISGLVFLGGVVVLCSALLIEASATQLYRYTRSEWWCGAVRVVGYGSISLVYFLAAFHNTALVVEHVSIEWVLTALL